MIACAPSGHGCTGTASAAQRRAVPADGPPKRKGVIAAAEERGCSREADAERARRRSGMMTEAV
jgi:hypothetical protein